MFNERQSISSKGRKQEFPAIKIDNVVIVLTGKILKTASIFDEVWLDCNFVDTNKIIEVIQESKNKPDIFTFCQLDFKKPRFHFTSEIINIAAIPISNYDHWWTKQINSKERNMIRKAQKNGVDVRLADFDEKLIEGIEKINNETPVRQGKPFWHYHKCVEHIKESHSSYLARSEFIGAYSNEELIGYIKIVYMAGVAGIMQIISTIKDRDKAPNNALIAKAVEICAKREVKYLIYGEYDYGKKEHNSLLDFKKKNGFIKIEYPRYYVPLTLKGKFAIQFGLHKGFMKMMPVWLITTMTKLRSDYYNFVKIKFKDH